MTILDVLKEDHRQVSELLKKISRARSVKSREKHFVEMKQDLEIHAFLEQLIFYSALQVSSENKDAVQHALDEHQKFVELLAELDSLPKEDKEWMTKFQTLKQSVDEHVREEESDLFRRARKSLTEKQLERLGAMMVTKKAEQLAVQ